MIRAPVYAEWGEGVRQPRTDHESQHELQLSRAFFAAFAHDLKNPLASLTLWADTLQLLEPRLASGARAQDLKLLHTVVEQINAVVRRSECVLDDLLDMSRLEAGHSLQLALAPIDLVGLAKRVLRARPATGHTLRLESTHSRLRGRWDGDRLGRVLDNLLANAIKYSPVHETITVHLARCAILGRGHAVLAVEDRGIGIPADDLPHVFEPFHRGSNVRPGMSGHGLGLWVSRAIVESHGGKLTVASREGYGTTVTACLPFSAAS